MGSWIEGVTHGTLSVGERVFPTLWLVSLKNNFRRKVTTVTRLEMSNRFPPE